MALLLRLVGGGGIRRTPIYLEAPLVTQWSRPLFTTPSSAGMQAQTPEDYWAKNKRLRRPVSPHMTIYKPQITSLLSLSHRASGIILSAAISGLGIGMLLLPGSYPYYLGVLQSMQFGGVLIYGAKFALALPFMFHLYNGVRHLVWDMGYGFTLRALYKSGYLVVGLSLLTSGAIAAL
ncbi:hypothetical protein Pmani_015012 [Petrolisthes manimaculis]|uniref:Succinate dehydrogenase cytochrome b560 subunit, mitochondrial n=1 Tax=Petrolisthes manimaculis TaxID=1843537 RepID=A0AAE1PVB3_9EUCA|nr:hypothetical protein Pmani_015012 [Petrolisthes manimaculis]